ncbi:hypothetical protein BH10BAC5_BH10BAC5_23220 [soil metagenome]
MNKLKILFAVMAMSLLFMSQAKADWGIKYGIEKFKSPLANERTLLEKDLKFERKIIGARLKDRSASPVKFYIDLKGGAGVSNANITPTGTATSYKTDSKTGLDLGALVYISLFDVVKFSTGLGYSNKPFDITTVSPTVPANPDTVMAINNQYMNIPLNINFGGMLSDKVGLTFNGGPYLGILLNTPDNNQGLGYKNFDLGLNGTVTANYKLNLLTSIIFGVNFDYGGLNNLGATDKVDRITTTKYGLFTGVRLGID